MVRCDALYLVAAVLECAHARHAGAPAAGVAPDDDYSDAFLDSYQLIEKYGFTAERHRAVTRDGYELTLFRVRAPAGAGADAPPVLLLHGVSDSSDCWLVLGGRSLALRLAAAGRDVWLLNARGNRYSRRHARRLPPPQYWDFSFEEVGTEDLAAGVDLVLARTGREQLQYVGFSQGTTAFLALCSLRPEYNRRFQRAVLLAPVAWMSGVAYPYADLLVRHLPAIVSALDQLGIYEMFPWNPAANMFHALACRDGHASKVLCDLEYLAFFGVRNASALMARRLAVVAAHVPAGAARGAFEHYLQVYATGRFARRDRGAAHNAARYGSARPPEYPLGRVSAPVVLLGSADDWFSSPRAVRRLHAALPRVVRSEVLNESLHFTHLEFVYGARVHLANDFVLSELAGS